MKTKTIFALITLSILNFTFIYAQDLYPLKKNDKYGYVDEDSNEVIGFKYDYAFEFNDDVTLVIYDATLFIIDKKGSETKVEKEYSNVLGFSEGMCGVFIDDHSQETMDWTMGGIMQGTITKYGFIDSKGKEVLPCEYDRVYSFKNGFAWVNKDELWWGIDKEMNMLTSYKYEKIEAFSEGLACVKRDGKDGFIDTKGKEVIPCQYEWASDFHHGMVSVSKEGKKASIINLKGDVVVPCGSRYCNVLSESRIMVNVMANDEDMYGLFGVIDLKGKIIIPIEYSMMHKSEKEGVLNVKKDGEYHSLDYSGKRID